MTRTDLHPDHLLARRRAGLLTPDEAARLDRHAARCATCAFEIAAAQDFARELDAPIDDKVLAAITAGVLRRLDANRTAGAPEVPRAVTTRVFSRRGLAFFVVALVASMAFAAVFVARRSMPRRASSSPVVDPPVAPRPPSPALVVRAPAATPLVPTETVAPRIVSEGLVSSPVARARSRHRRAAQPAATAATPSERSDARTLFEQALAARREGRYTLAASLFERLQRRYGDSEEASVSQIALGRLCLDRLAQPARALAQFDRYLAARRHGESREEAMVGRAVALERLGRTTAALEAWEAVQRAFPGSVSARRAASRIDALR